MGQYDLGICDWTGGGHNSTYVNAYARASFDAGLSCAVYLPSDVRESFDISSDLVVTYHRTRSFSSIRANVRPLFQQIWKIATLKHALSKEKIETVFFPNVMFYDFPKQRTMFEYVHKRVAIQIISLRVSDTNAFINEGIQKNTIFNSRNVISVSVINPVDLDLVKQLCNKPVHLGPDITNIVLENVSAVTPEYDILVLGQIDSRKALPELLGWLRQRDQKVRLRICGPINPNDEFFNDTLTNLPAKHDIVIENRRLSDGTEFNSKLVSSRIAWVAYKNFNQNSNVLIKAAHFSVPTIVVSGTILADYSTQFGLGASIQSYEYDHIEAAYTNCDLSVCSRKLEARKEWVRFHTSPESVCNHLINRVLV